MLRPLRVVSISILAAIAPSIALAQAGTIFRIRAGGCTLDPMNRALAGFMVEGEDGIVTALHGVADCADITAQSSSPQGTIILKIANEDKRLDAARLVPADATEASKFVALKPSLVPFKKLAPSAFPNRGVAVTALGFEGGVLSVQYNTRLTIGNPPKERLGNILGSKNQDIVDRKSPSIELSVIKLEGTVNKGESVDR